MADQERLARSVRSSAEAADALCQEQAGDDITIDTGRRAIEAFGLPVDELTDLALERAEEMTRARGEDALFTGTMGFATGFLSGVIHGRGQLDTLLAGLKAEVETRRAEVKAIDESAETLTGEEICEMQMHAEIADRLEHLIKQAGGEQ